MAHVIRKLSRLIGVMVFALIVGGLIFSLSAATCHFESVKHGRALTDHISNSAASHPHNLPLKSHPSNTFDCHGSRAYSGLVISCVFPEWTAPTSTLRLSPIERWEILSPEGFVNIVISHNLEWAVHLPRTLYDLKTSLLIYHRSDSLLKDLKNIS